MPPSRYFFVILLAALGLAQQPTLASRDEFAKAAAPALLALRKGHFDVFAELCSADGVKVVRRSVDWKSTKAFQSEDDKAESAEEKASFLALDNRDVLVWSDAQAHFDSVELNQQGFRKIFEQFRRFVKNSDAYTHGGTVRASRDLWDEWHSLYLGPGFSGKLASNCYWYICLKREQGKWKVWQLAYAVH